MIFHKCSARAYGGPTLKLQGVDSKHSARLVVLVRLHVHMTV